MKNRQEHLPVEGTKVIVAEERGTFRSIVPAEQLFREHAKIVAWNSIPGETILTGGALTLRCDPDYRK